MESLAGLLATEAFGSLACQTGAASAEAPLQHNCPGLVACLQMLHVLLQGSGATSADLMLRQAAATKCIAWCLKGGQGPAVSRCTIHALVVRTLQSCCLLVLSSAQCHRDNGESTPTRTGLHNTLHFMLLV